MLLVYETAVPLELVTLAVYVRFAGSYVVVNVVAKLDTRVNVVVAGLTVRTDVIEAGASY